MSNYTSLKSAIQQVIKTNGNNEITGALLQQELLAMIDSLGVGYQFMGIATPSTNPGTPDQNVFYVASVAGTYSNFNNIIVVENEVVILKWNGAWSKESSGAASEDSVYLIENLLSGITPLSGAIRSDGSIQSHPHYKYYKITNRDYVKVKGLASTFGGGDYVKVAFYNSAEIGSASFMGGVEQYVSYTVESFDVAVPNGCVTIVVSQYLNNTTVCNGYTTLKESIEELAQEISNIQIQLANKASRSELNALDERVVDIEEKIFDVRESGQIDGKYIQLSGTYRWADIAGTISRYIKVKRGDVIHFVKSSNPRGYCTCVQSIDPSDPIVFKSGFNGVATTVVDSTYNITEDCYFYWVERYGYEQSYEPDTLTLNGEDIISGRYEKDIIAELEEKEQDNEDAIGVLQQSVGKIEQTQDDLVINKEVKHGISYFTLNGYYASDGPTLIDLYGYKSCPLVPVADGQKVRLHNWLDYDKIGAVQVFALYDNDNLPYDGVSARVNSYKLTKISTGEYEYILPSNVSQMGISINQFPQDAYFTVNGGEYELTQAGVKMIEDAITPDEDTGDKSANYYLKGNSNIVYSPSKKLGIIAAGQSNIDGRNAYADLPAGFVNPNAKVRFCNNTNGTFADFQITDGGRGDDWSFDAIVYDLLTKSAYGNQSEIYVMKKSMGGTSIDKDGATNYHWTADYEYLSSPSYSLLLTFESIIRKAIELQGTNFEIKAFLWHQGEGDADSLAVANRYYDNLKNMLAYVRGIIGNPRLNFFCGSISNNNHYNQYKDIINAAYFKLASEDPYFHLVDMSNAVLKDSWHFNAEWSIYFGQKVYDLMIDAGVITGTKINPSEPT